MKRRILAAVFALALLLGSQASAWEADGLIEVGFRMLEEGNPFVRRFEERSGRKVETLFPQGVPYLFAGKESSAMFRWYPEYARCKAPRDSTHFRKGEFYIYGLDCSGFTNYINKNGHRKQHGTLQEMMNDPNEAKAHHLYDQRMETPPPDWPELKDVLQVGDYLLIHRDGALYRHIMMYIGTMRDFGYTEEEEPELAAYLDYPLVLHCGTSPVYGERFQKIIDGNPEKYSPCHTTDGGVQISIVGVKPEEAPEHIHVQQTDFDYFIMRDGGYWLTAVNMTGLKSWCWYR